ncbi:hypothetical protein BO94DRAFT_112453 [Aspergillus sclerotioniger CBS 115572]|uniref:Uncharacterized protein n=1 Tax=Aspergillus sclerotioniger CBS 115572 TaxID=1450535 RepID=A0A317WHK6_9EURO|nr:hypothetical protein BO94DRAFT_112453 [Aspergillus sclerotioniger CBS 115572]PWY83680.1 hypothetical protein BO94DRAFT_112453 [Aspergillus sclerotioniger CBS 115572]
MQNHNHNRILTPISIPDTTNTNDKNMTLRRWLSLKPKPKAKSTPNLSQSITTTAKPRGLFRSKTPAPTSIPIHTDPNPLTNPTSTNTPPASTVTTNPPQTGPPNPPPPPTRTRTPLSILNLNLHFNLTFTPKGANPNPNPNPNPDADADTDATSTTTASTTRTTSHLIPQTTSEQELTSSYAAYCEAFTSGLTDENYLHASVEDEQSLQQLQQQQHTVQSAEGRGKEKGPVYDVEMQTDTRMDMRLEGGEEEDDDRVLPSRDDQREVLHWLRNPDDQDQDQDDSVEHRRISPPARILTPARYEQSRRAVRLQQRRQDRWKREQQQQQRHAWWTAIRTGWARVRRRAGEAANPENNRHNRQGYN